MDNNKYLRNKYMRLANTLEEAAQAIRQLVEAVEQAEKSLPGSSILDKSLRNAGLSEGVVNALGRRFYDDKGIIFVSDLVNETADNLLGRKNFGVIRLAEVRVFLEKHGLHLRGE